MVGGMIEATAGLRAANAAVREAAATRISAQRIRTARRAPRISDPVDRKLATEDLVRVQ